MLNEFLQLIQASVMRKNKVDEWDWRGENNLQYKVRLTYKYVRNEMSDNEEEVYKKFWKTKTLPSAQICPWRVVKDMC